MLCVGVSMKNPKPYFLELCFICIYIYGSNTHGFLINWHVGVRYNSKDIFKFEP